MVLVRRAAVTIHHYLCPQKTAAAAAGALQLTTLISRFKFLMRSQNPAGYCPVPRCPGAQTVMLMLQQARHGFSLLQMSDATGAAFTWLYYEDIIIILLKRCCHYLAASWLFSLNSDKMMDMNGMFFNAQILYTFLCVYCMYYHFWVFCIFQIPTLISTTTTTTVEQ